eukprot:GFUD01044641.1.p1 GENE.GFUD01044641.1~~GFUD01044641.1.p1  ORF type:complete len:112 (-),score=25.31 GFUD01044641.1:94-429(-)
MVSKTFLYMSTLYPSTSSLLLPTTLMLQVNAQAAPDRPLHDVKLLPQPLHPTLQPVSAGDHLLQITKVPIQPFSFLILLIQHSHVLGQVAGQDEDHYDGSVHQGRGDLPLD